MTLVPTLVFEMLRFIIRLLCRVRAVISVELTNLPDFAISIPMVVSSWLFA